MLRTDWRANASSSQQGDSSTMNSTSASSTATVTTTAGASELPSLYSTQLPTFPPRPPPPRRENAVRPPALTTSLSGVAFQGGGRLPATPATMSSPFIPSSSVPLSGLASPMSARPSNYGTAARYNPQEWGPIGANTSASPSIGIGVLTPLTTPMSAAPRGIPDESLSRALPVPPPPYSPPRTTPQAQSPRPAAASSAQSNVSPTYHHHSSLSPAQQHQSTLSYQAPVARRRPSSMVYGGDLPPAGLTTLPPPPPPPPPPPSARPHQESPLSSTSRPGSIPIQQGYPSDAVSPGRFSPEAHTPHYNNSSAPIPPGSRRAASTGDIESRGTHGYARSRRWEPGMPLPPPPPGPPPAVSSPPSRRPSYEHFNPSSGRERTRQSPAVGTSLSTVPPTPADWADTNDVSQTPNIAQNRRRPSDAEPPSAVREAPTAADARATITSTQSTSEVGSEHSSSNRTINSKGIRERRIEARVDGGSGDSSDTTAWPADLILASPGATGLTRRRTVTKSTPRSARSNHSDEPKGSATSVKSPFGHLTSSTGDFPTPTGQTAQPRERSNSTTMQTPPFSPDFERPAFSLATRGGDFPPAVPPKALPTPPLSLPAESSPRLAVSPGQERPISHLLHLPVDASPTHAPLIPRRPSIGPQRIVTEPDEIFLRESEERYREFLVKEAEAASDADGLRVFCDFIVAESAIRRKRYESVWANGSFELQDLVSKLFKEPGEPKEQPTRIATTQSSPALSSAPVSPSVQRRLTVDTGPWSQYRPTLSPIASMSISNDEMSSRGRAPSRWWESQTGSESGGNGAKVRRSKRETKYMGLPREMREAMQFEEVGAVSGNECCDFPPTNPFATYGPNEYPPEKVGLHEDQTQTQTPLRRVPSNGQEKLDISRLVTLPPPYPRHYPAVNNNHPDLSFYRSTVRSVSDLSELKITKQNYQIKVNGLREEHEKRLQEERRHFKAGMNRGIEEGSISYAEAAEAEAIRRDEEHEQEKELVQAEYDLYQEEVYKPMRSILSDRINIVSTCIDELRGKLFDSAQHETPNQTQEGGDEQPELLEKLTQLKWLFEARETLYREEFNLQSEHDEKYRILVTLPYHQANNREKIQETVDFFTSDAQDRAVSFAAETFRRFESFMAVIEDNVSRGVETQLSAFWDIAPSILDLLQRIPQDLRGFAVKIPQKEYDENPSYYRYPLQYLYSLVSHAEKSTYQFIEAQTNLLCLLHEVKSGLMNANCRYMELLRVKSGEDAEVVRAEMRESREEEERVLTADLKEKVGMVEEQWDGALGKVLEDVKERVQRWLEDQGGWEEMVQMEMEQA